MKQFLTISFLVCSWLSAADYVITKPFDFTQTAAGRVENGAFIWHSGTACSTNPNAFNIIQQAFQNWMVAGSTVKFSGAGAETVQPTYLLTYATVDYNHIENHVSFRKDYATFGPAGSSAVTLSMTFSYGANTGWERDIVFDDNQTWDDTKLLHAAEHEIGHILGFPDFTDATYSTRLM